MKTECDYLSGWIKKTVTYAKLTQNSEPQRTGTQKKKKKSKGLVYFCLRDSCPGRSVLDIHLHVAWIVSNQEMISVNFQVAIISLQVHFVNQC